MVLDEKGVEIKYLTLVNCLLTGPNSIFLNTAGEIYLTVTVLNDINNSSDIGVLKLVF